MSSLARFLPSLTLFAVCFGLVLATTVLCVSFTRQPHFDTARRGEQDRVCLADDEVTSVDLLADAESTERQSSVHGVESDTGMSFEPGVAT